VRDVALDVNLRLLTIGGSGQGNVAVDAWARTGSNSADHAALARRVAALKDHDDTSMLGSDPSLQADKLHLELRKFLLKFLALHLA
jgi:hypothetical protein